MKYLRSNEGDFLNIFIIKLYINVKKNYKFKFYLNLQVLTHCLEIRFQKRLSVKIQEILLSLDELIFILSLLEHDYYWKSENIF